MSENNSYVGNRVPDIFIKKREHFRELKRMCTRRSGIRQELAAVVHESGDSK